MSSKNDDIKWSSFANQHALVTAPTLLLGGLILIIGKFNWWPIGIYTIVIGFLIIILEYPRTAKSNNTPNASRPYQHILGNLFAKLGFLYVNYFPRFILYSALSIPCLLTLSTIIPALNLLITAGLYLLFAFNKKSNFKKEKWMQVDQKQEAYKSVTVIQAPERPPPRTLSDLQ